MQSQNEDAAVWEPSRAALGVTPTRLAEAGSGPASALLSVPLPPPKSTGGGHGRMSLRGSGLV